MASKNDGGKVSTPSGALSGHLSTIGQSAVFYPKTLFRILIEVNHEPLPPVAGRSWFGFGRRVHYLPNVFTYCKYIRRTEGWTGLYRGVLPNVLSVAAQQAAASCCSAVLPPETKKDAQSDPVYHHGREIARKVGIRAVSVLVSQPFQVITIRMVAYYVGREVAYSTFTGTVRAIYANEGIGGFFSGIVPRLVGETLAVVAFELMVPVVMKIAEVPEMDNKATVTLRDHARVVVSFLVQIVVYPLHLTSTLMAIDGSGMAAAAAIPPNGVGSWTGCLGALYACGEHMRGGGLFNRIDKNKRHVRPPPVRGTAV